MRISRFTRPLGVALLLAAGAPLTDVSVSADSSLVRASTFGRGFWELVP